MFDFKNEFYATLGKERFLVVEGEALTKPASIGSRGQRSLVQGVGVNDWKYSVGNKTGMAPAYSNWATILQRCNSSKNNTANKSYSGCSVAKEWCSLTRFLDFYLPLAKDGWQVDKDILVVNNKIYSPKTCLVVPSWVNTLLINRQKKRGHLPQGLCQNKNSYQVQCSLGESKPKYLGSYRDIMEAMFVYASTKYQFIEHNRTELDLVGVHNNLKLSLCDLMKSNFKQTLSEEGYPSSILCAL